MTRQILLRKLKCEAELFAVFTLNLALNFHAVVIHTSLK